MKEIALTHGHVAFVDDDDFERVNQFKWHYDPCGKGYARRNVWVNNKSHVLRMHRFVLGVKNRRIFIDHVNRNGLDNRKSNLRICTRSQNVMNTIKKEGCSSIYKGVSYNKRRHKWIVRITMNRIVYYLGAFQNEEEAALTYNNKAKELFGEFACLDKIRKVN